MAVRIGGKRIHLWRAVDAEGTVFDMLVQAQRTKAAAFKLTRGLLRKHGVAPQILVADRLPSDQAAFRKLGLATRRRAGLRLDDRAENSHRPIRRREREQQRFKSA